MFKKLISFLGAHVFAKKIKFLIDPFLEEKIYWERLYQDLFNMEVDFNVIEIPQKPNDKNVWRLFLFPKGLTIGEVYKVYEKILSSDGVSLEILSSDCVWSLYDLNNSLNINRRDPKNHEYAIWIRYDQNPQFIFGLGNSPKNIDPNGYSGGITLLERIVLGIIFLIENKKHLDTRLSTMCSGSGSAIVGYPNVIWENSKWVREVEIGIYQRVDSYSSKYQGAPIPLVQFKKVPLVTYHEERKAVRIELVDVDSWGVIGYRFVSC